MTPRIASLLTLLLLSILCWSAVFAPMTAAQEEIPTDTAALPSSVPSDTHPFFTQQELDQMLAPIALYPDQLLSHILRASTYPLEVIEAARWSKAHPNLEGDQAVQAVSQESWDPSVKALVAFPQMLSTMDEKLSWMEQLGEAFLSQQPQLMDTVQELRQKASTAGHLVSNDQILVNQQEQSIIIEPANPQIVYVPYYDPLLIYGPWWWPGYPPVYWGAWPGYDIGPGFGPGFTWGVGIGVGAGWFIGGFGWPSHEVLLGSGRIWAHNPVHRRNVPYRDLALRQQFRPMGAMAGARREFRGHEPSSFEGRGGLGNLMERRDAFGSRPEVRQTESSPHAFEGVGHGASEEDFSARGRRSQDFGPSRRFWGQSSGGFHGGGEGGFRAGGGFRGGGRR